MKQTVKILKEIDFQFISIDVAVRYDDEDMPYDFPLRDGNTWKAKVEIDTGQVEGWPIGRSGSFDMKVCDQGIYSLYDRNSNVVAGFEGYVPHGIVPGSYGDYIKLDIDDNGIITNWPKNPNVDDFFNEE